MVYRRPSNVRAPRAIRKKTPKRANAGFVLSKPMKSLVLKEINRTSESRQRTTASVLINFDGPIGATDWFTVIPAIVQGDARENRNGAEITLTSLVIRGFIRMTPDGTTAGDALMGRLFVVSAKRSALNIDVTDLSNNLLKEGSQPRAFDGTLDHVWLPTNAQYVTAHHDKRMMFVTDHISYIDGGTGGNSEDTRVSQRIVVKPFTIALKVKGKVLKYSTNSSQYPENYVPQIGLGFVNLNSASPDLNTRLTMAYHVTMTWKDH